MESDLDFLQALFYFTFLFSFQSNSINFSRITLIRYCSNIWRFMRYLSSHQKFLYKLQTVT